MHRDAMRTSLQALGGSARDAGDTQMARVAHQGDLVDVDGKRGLGHVLLPGRPKASGPLGGQHRKVKRTPSGGSELHEVKSVGAIFL